MSEDEEFADLLSGIGIRDIRPEKQSAPPPPQAPTITIPTITVSGTSHVLAWIKENPAERFLAMIGSAETTLASEHIPIGELPASVFDTYYENMQRRINDKNLDAYALYTLYALIMSKPYGNATDPIAISAYYLIKEGTSQEATPEMIRNAHVVLSTASSDAIERLYKQEGLADHTSYLALERIEEHITNEHDPYLRFLAARSVLTKHHTWNGEKRVIYGEWKGKMERDMLLLIEQMRLRWYWMVLSVLESQTKWYLSQIASSMQ